MPRFATLLTGSGLAATAALAAASVAAEQINVSKIVTGTETTAHYAELNQPAQAEGAQADFTLATDATDPDGTLYFNPTPWGSTPTATPGAPKLSRELKLSDYSEGGADFSYDQHFTSSVAIDMTPAAKPVIAKMFKSGGGQANVSYRVVVTPPPGPALDYFVTLSIPQLARNIAPAYDLCCSGDSNGGTYSYHRPKFANARAAVDLYADDLPIWSTESGYIYPNTGNAGTPFDKLEVAWDKATPAGTSTLYLGKLSAPVALTLVVRVEAHGDSDCGTQKYGLPGSNTYAKHCLTVSQQVTLGGGTGGQPAGFAVAARTPQ